MIVSTCLVVAAQLTICAMRVHRSVTWRGVAAGELIGRIADSDGSRAIAALREHLRFA
jgi:hypothetical protein